ncbi:hypothetical protein SDJN02_10127 [Cucurbita argyrosperma subsp. argyrosperma]|nr:hypothetical protein SDJN02_10127 [Cucurbita argyrosperma subsp. argyrosperma]
MKQLYIDYKHVRIVLLEETLLGEILGAVVLAEECLIEPALESKPVKIFADSDESQDGQTVIYEPNSIDLFAKRVSDKIQSQSAVIKSFSDQKGMWNKQTAKPRLSLLPLVMCLLIFIQLLGHLNEKNPKSIGMDPPAFKIRFSSCSKQSFESIYPFLFEKPNGGKMR